MRILTLPSVKLITINCPCATAKNSLLTQIHTKNNHLRNQWCFWRRRVPTVRHNWCRMLNKLISWNTSSGTNEDSDSRKKNWWLHFLLSVSSVPLLQLIRLPGDGFLMPTFYPPVTDVWCIPFRKFCNWRGLSFGGKRESYKAICLFLKRCFNKVGEYFHLEGIVSNNQKNDP